MRKRKSTSVEGIDIIIDDIIIDLDLETKLNVKGERKNENNF